MGLLAQPRKPSWSASSAHRWMQCSGCVGLCRWVERSPSSIYAREGTAAHHLAAICLEDGCIHPTHLIGEKLTAEQYYEDDYTFTVSNDMALAVGKYTSLIESLASHHKETIILIEKKISLASINKNMRGVIDCSLVVPGESLKVLDYKHGKGVIVDIEDNEQLIYYALGVIEKLDSMGVDTDFKTIELFIVQPRSFGASIKSWLIDNPRKFVNTWHGKIKKAYIATIENQDEYHINKDCRWCNGLVWCPKLKEFCLDIQRNIEGRYKQMKDLKPSELTELIRVAPSVNAYLQAVAGHGKELALNGKKFDGYKLVQAGRSSRNWLSGKEADVISFLEDECFLDEEDFKTGKLMSPAQLEKEIPAKLFDKLGKFIHRKSSSGFALVPNSDRRQAVTTAEDDFEDDFDDLFS
ncbi:MAG: DUF2800 domain-containing protein [Candidatus Thorarchaeota archaeon]